MRRYKGLCRVLGGILKSGYCAELFEDASLVKDYKSVRSSYCAVSLAIAY